MNAIFSRMKKIFFSVLGEIWEDKNKSEGDMFIKWPWAQFLWKTIQKKCPVWGVYPSSDRAGKTRTAVLEKRTDRCGCARCVRPDLGPNIFSYGPPTQSISSTYYWPLGLIESFYSFDISLPSILLQLSFHMRNAVDEHYYAWRLAV